MKQNRKDPYLKDAYDSSGVLRVIQEAEYGEKYTCRICGSVVTPVHPGPYDANKKCFRQPHFRHGKGADCLATGEKRLHLLAKEILEEVQMIMLPPLSKGENGQLLHFDRVDKEDTDAETKLRPDCTCYYGDKVMWVEFKRTHQVDTKKAEKIRKREVDCIEIDLNEFLEDQDKESVERFLVQSDRCREWIYNKELKFWKKNFSTKVATEYIPEIYTPLPQHFALDENNHLVYANKDLPDKEYTCPSCGNTLKLMQPLYDPHFLHIGNVYCSNDKYIKISAREAIRKCFETEGKFEVKISCTSEDTCRFIDPERCTNIIHDLKKWGYTECETDYKDGERNIYYDVVLKSDKHKDAPIVISINTPDFHEYIETPLRHIVIWCNSEKQIKKIWDMRSLVDIQLRTLNFKSSSIRIFKISYYKSGKTYDHMEICTHIYTPRKSSVFEIIFPKLDEKENKDEARKYFMLRCFENKLECYMCPICYHLKQRLDGTLYCNRHRTKGTDENPTITKPKGCNYFNINRDIRHDLYNKFGGKALEFKYQ